MTLPTDAAARKAVPLATGVLDYFPDALAAVAQCSQVGNDQHNPGQPLHWDRAKSGDEADALLRHLLQRGTIDSDGVRHSTKVAWRALANLQKEIEAAREQGANGARFFGEVGVFDALGARIGTAWAETCLYDGFSSGRVTGACAPFHWRATPYDAHPFHEHACGNPPRADTGD